MSKVGVIIPVYNVEKYLRECLDSVINQTLRDIEIICADDGSTDGSLSILEEYAKKDNRIKLLQLKENNGPGVARNIAFKYVTAPYIMYLDSDDWFELNACETAYNQIVKNNNDMVMFGNYSCLKETKKVSKSLDRYIKYENYSNIKFADIDKPYSQLALCFKIYSKNFLVNNKISFEEVKYYEDMQFFYQILLANPDISIIFKPLYNYRKREGSITASSSTFQQEIEVRSRLLKLITDSENQKYIKFFIISYVNTILNKYKKFSKNSFMFQLKNYNKIHKIFRDLNKIINITEIKEEIKYKEVSDIMCNSCFMFVFRMLLKNLFSVVNSKDKKYKIITISGMKIKIGKYLSGRN